MKTIFLLSLIFMGIYSYSQHWTFLGFPDEKIHTIAVHPQNPNIIFVSGDNLYKSSDGGINWDTVSLYSFNSITFHPIPDTMYATLGEGSYSDGIYKSIDGGNYWNILEWLYLSTSLTIPGYPQGTLVAGTKGMGVYESSDYGDTWTTINDSLDNLNVLSLTHINPFDCDSGQVYFAGTEGGIFYYNYDLHEYWNNTNTATNITIPAISSDGDGTGYSLWAAIDGGSWSDGMYKSTDYGLTWIISEYCPFITDILINPLNPNTVYAADSGYGVKKTINGGISWQVINTGLGDSVVYCLAQSPANTMHLYAGTEHGLYVYDFSVGINKKNIKQHMNITIFPNPANDKITIKSYFYKITKVDIVNIEGKLLQNFILKTSETSINIDNLERGVYFLKIYTEKEVITNKLIKK